MGPKGQIFNKTMLVPFDLERPKLVGMIAYCGEGEVCAVLRD